MRIWNAFWKCLSENCRSRQLFMVCTSKILYIDDSSHFQMACFLLYRKNERVLESMTNRITHYSTTQIWNQINHFCHSKIVINSNDDKELEAICVQVSDRERFTPFSASSLSAFSVNPFYGFQLNNATIRYIVNKRIPLLLKFISMFFVVVVVRKSFEIRIFKQSFFYWNDLFLFFVCLLSVFKQYEVEMGKILYFFMHRDEFSMAELNEGKWSVSIVNI